MYVSVQTTTEAGTSRSCRYGLTAVRLEARHPASGQQSPLQDICAGTGLTFTLLTQNAIGRMYSIHQRG